MAAQWDAFPIQSGQIFLRWDTYGFAVRSRALIHDNGKGAFWRPPVFMPRAIYIYLYFYLFQSANGETLCTLWAKPYALGQAPSIAAICLCQL